MRTEAGSKTDLESRVHSRGVQTRLLSQEHGLETLRRFLQTHCAKPALPGVGSHLQAFFFKLKRNKYEPMAS